MRILGVIPARWGSKAIPRKNVFPLCGLPLVQYTVNAVKESILQGWVITSDSAELEKYGPFILRPKELAGDKTPMVPVIQHVIKELGASVDAVMTLQPTSPLRLAEDINNALTLFLSDDAASLVSVAEGVHPVKSYDEQGRPFLEQVPYDKRRHKCYTRNGAVFITRMDLLESGRLFDEKPLLYIMPKYRSIDIDSYDDMAFAEALLKIRGEAH